MDSLRKKAAEDWGGPDHALEQRFALALAAVAEADGRADKAEAKVMGIAEALEECQAALSAARACTQRARRTEDAGGHRASCQCTHLVTDGPYVSACLGGEKQGRAL